ncbi:hypothetical protein F5X96DRAFT_673779 [Biscogniauxia mediterranea]|nr:hypothetical protein F5X96DRAFT_673779 [Biscogniauxia mediterranea]
MNQTPISFHFTFQNNVTLRNTATPYPSTPLPPILVALPASDLLGGPLQQGDRDGCPLVWALHAIMSPSGTSILDTPPAVSVGVFVHPDAQLPPGSSRLFLSNIDGTTMERIPRRLICLLAATLGVVAVAVTVLNAARHCLLFSNACERLRPSSDSPDLRSR